jgi:hypothetical protein
MISNKSLLLVFLLLSINTIGLFGQIPVIKTPQPASLSPNVIVGNPNNRNNPMSNIPAFSGYNNSNRQQIEMIERDMLEVQHRNAAMQLMADEEDMAYFSSNHAIQYDLPSCVGIQGTEYYYYVAEKLLDMLHGETSLNLKEAVFSVEDAYFEGQLDRAKYENAISELALTAQLKARQDGYDWNNAMTRNVMLFRTMSDTLTVKFPLRENSSVSYPMRYDYDDPWGHENLSKLFVTKLLETRMGQCHSLPLLYLILCETVGTEANLAFSPNHSYIKLNDRQGNWYNLELTQGKIVTDAFMIGSGFITSEAIKHGLYMEPQTQKQTIAHCLSDLAAGYVQKYGYDQFVIQCVDSVLKYAPGNISALALKSNYHSAHFEYTVNQAGRPPKDILIVNYPRIYELLEERNNFYRKMDEIGYRDIPEEAYKDWLRVLDEEKEKQEHNEKYNKVLQIIR